MVHVNAATDDNRSTKDTVRARYTQTYQECNRAGRYIEFVRYIDMFFISDTI